MNVAKELAIALVMPLAVICTSRLGLCEEVAGPVKLTLHAAAEPTPAMKYSLLPTFLEQTPGNAAVHYGKVTAEEQVFFSRRYPHLDNVDRWHDTPLEELVRDEVHLLSGEGIEGSLRRAARCEYCDWQLPIREERFFTIRLAEVQQTRQFGRILAVRARLQMAHGEFDDAIETFATGYALARNVAEGQTIVNGLVGISICGSLNKQMLDYVQQPDAPNLYWAFTQLPKPMIDMRAALEVEANGIELSFPELRDLERADRAPEEWRDFTHRFAREIIELAGNDDTKLPKHSPEEVDKICEELRPVAKSYLKERGISAEQLDPMSTHQLALLYTLRLHRELFDEAAKYFFLPYPQAIAGIDRAIEKAKAIDADGPHLIQRSTLTLPAIRTLRIATARNDRQFALLRMLEALRTHAAGHQGKLPIELSDIVDVPIPDDPVTGRPFEYQVANGIASLSGPSLPDAPFDYEIEMVAAE